MYNIARVKPIKNKENNTWTWGKQSPIFDNKKDCVSYGMQIVLKRLREIRDSLKNGNTIQAN